MSLDYSVLADIYDELYGEEQAAKHEAVIARVRLVEPVLDVGCGTGLLLKQLPCYCVGLDCSLAMLKVAKARGRVEHGDLVCARAEQMPFRVKSFFTVFSVTVLHESPLALNEILNVLKPGGEAAVTILRKRIELLPRLLELLPHAVTYESEALKDVVVTFRKSENP